MLRHPSVCRAIGQSGHPRMLSKFLTSRWHSAGTFLARALPPARPHCRKKHRRGEGVGRPGASEVQPRKRRSRFQNRRPAGRRRVPEPSDRDDVPRKYRGRRRVRGAGSPVVESKSPEVPRHSRIHLRVRNCVYRAKLHAGPQRPWEPGVRIVGRNLCGQRERMYTRGFEGKLRRSCQL